jgi:hypothetical protein
MTRKTCGDCPLLERPHLCLRYRIEEVEPATTECEARYHWRLFEEYARVAKVQIATMERKLERLQKNFETYTRKHPKE